MAYDLDLAERIREVMAGQRGVTEKAMFGGLAFLIGGNMAVAASGQGGLLLRADPSLSEKYVTSPHVERAVMIGRPMDGWLRVDPEGVRTKAQLQRWVKVGTEYAASLPKKAPARTTKK